MSKPASNPPTKKSIVATQSEMSPETLEKVIIGADLAGLNPQQRVEYYLGLCKSLDLNPATRPFEFITLDGKQVLYPRRDATDQIRKRDGIVIKIVSRALADGLYIVTASGKNSAGREDESIGVESMEEPLFVKEWNPQSRSKEWRPNPIAGSPLPPAVRAVAMMKAETKAKRRVTLSLGGLGMMDESEIEGALQAGEFQPAPAAQDAIDAHEEAREKAARDARGGTLELVEPEKPVAGDWREVECHIGKAEGPMLGKKLGELPQEVLAWLVEKWLPKAGKTKKDKVLAAALAEVPKAEKEPEPPKEKPVEKPAEFNWREVKVHIGKSLRGKPIDELTKEQIEKARKNMFTPGLIDPDPAKQSDEDKTFVAAILAACQELGI